MARLQFLFVAFSLWPGVALHLGHNQLQAVYNRLTSLQPEKGIQLHLISMLIRV